MDHTAIHPDKFKAALKKINDAGMYGVIEVTKKGEVINGNHRVLVARMLGIAVDIVIH